MKQDLALGLISRGVGALAGVRGERWALIVPASGHGSLGDAAMTLVARDRLREQGYKVCLLADDTWAPLSGFDDHVPADPYLFDGDRRTFLDVMWRTRRVGAAFLIGADILDGIYNPDSVIRRLKILSTLAQRGCAATVLGSSFNEAPNPVCVAALRQLPPSVAIHARDPVSRARMAAHLERPIGLVADLAFLCPRDEAGEPEAFAFIAGERDAGRKIVALTANFLVARKTGGFEAAHVPFLKAVIAAGHSVVMVPHDTRKTDSDKAVLERIAARLTDGERTHTHLIPADDPQRVKAVLAGCDLGVTSRMHAAILAMGAGVPALCFGYQGKFEGLFDLVGLADEDLLHAPEALVADPEGLARCVIGKLAERERLAAKLAARLPAVKAMSRANFSPDGAAAGVPAPVAPSVTERAA
ncbi:polysaccharide pyruvyl transferase family protein [Acuticoccus sediminis]|uniref:polysaccharide pyruvyl transferase family protein n=1 Tax=Acuticoccus sediminis TaxID=2184697 RepID=UPI001CFEB4A9|nr:polysaccharide pyruvyl transferase family protein [Acuticoccus sediminis]